MKLPALLLLLLSLVAPSFASPVATLGSGVGMVCTTQPETNRYAELLRKADSWWQATSLFRTQSSSASEGGECMIEQIMYKDPVTFDRFENGQMAYRRVQIVVNSVFDPRKRVWVQVEPLLRYAILWSEIQTV